MMRFNRQLLLTLLLLCGSNIYCFAISAGDSGKQYRDSVYRRVIKEGVLTLSCYFSYVQNSSDINPNLGDNRHELDKLNAFIRATLADTALYVKRVRLTGFCSIEGTYAVNERLARDRVQFFQMYLDDRYRLSEMLPVDISWVAEDWGSLYDYVLNNSINGREEILRLIEETDVFGDREAQLMYIQGGRTYQWLLQNYFPKLRRVEIRVEYDLQRILQNTYQREFGEGEFDSVLAQERARLREEVREEILESLPPIDVVYNTGESKVTIQGYGELHSITHTEVRPYSIASSYSSRPYSINRPYSFNTRLYDTYYPKWSVKTNLMQLAGFARGFDYSNPLPNLSVEYFFTQNISVEAGVEYSNWAYDNGIDKKYYGNGVNKEYQGMSGYRIEPRFWLRHDKSLCSFYVGVFGQAGDFNLHKLRLNAANGVDMLTGKYYEGGLSVGCYLPFSDHWGVDMGVRGSFRQTKDQYYKEEEHRMIPLYNRILGGFRLTSVLSLSYRLGY
jgi:hypothetical protein